MTNDEFYKPYERLCQRFKLEPSPEQARIWYQRFGQRYPVAVWEGAVDELVAQMRMPLADQVFKAVDDAATASRRTQLAQDRRSARDPVLALGSPSFVKPGGVQALFDYMRAKGCGMNEAMDTILPAWIQAHPEDALAAESWARIQQQRAKAERVQREQADRETVKV